MASSHTVPSTLSVNANVNANINARSSQATNDSNEPAIFLSQEAKIEENYAGEIFYVPSPSERQASDTQPGDSGSDFEAYWIDKGLMRLHASHVETSPFDCAVVHSHCLGLFHRFGKARHLDVDEARTNPTETNPTTLSQLLRAFALRRAIFTTPAGWPSRMAFWQHCFFGAQQAGWDQEAWRNYAGDELYCADPISVSRLADFASSYDEMPLERGPVFEGPENKEITPSGLFDLPIEIFEQVCNNLDLRSVCCIRSTCHRAREQLPHLPTFWRSRCIAMHGDWFWELSDPSTFPPQTTNWMQILWQIELARTEILDQAGFVPGEHPTEYLRNHKLYEENIYRPMIFDIQGRRKLPLGLKNRLRIWMCMQCIGKDGRQIKLAGQKKGLDVFAHHLIGT